MPRINPKRSAAFTLVEVLAVVIILGIASAVIVPQIGTRDDLKAAAAARIVMADLIYAQNRAIATQQMHYVRFDTGNNRYGVSTAPTGAYLTHPIDKNEYLTSFGASGDSGLEDITLSSADFDGQSTLAFDSLGTPYAVGGSTTALTDGSIVLTSGSFQLTVTVEPFTGEISVE